MRETVLTSLFTRASRIKGFIFCFAALQVTGWQSIVKQVLISVCLPRDPLEKLLQDRANSEQETSDSGD